MKHKKNRVVAFGSLKDFTEQAKNGITANVIDLFLLHRKLSDEDITNLCQTLSLFKQKIKLNLGSNHLQNNSIKTIASFLTRGNCQMLDISENDFNEEGLQAILNALEHCPEDFRLNLNFNLISHTGIEILAQTLTNQKCPKNLSLSLSDCQLGNEGAEILGKALQHKDCTSGLRIDLCYNNITKANALAESLKYNACVKMYLEANPLTDDYKEFLVNSLKQNTAIIVFYLTDCTSKQSQIIHHCCYRNRCLFSYKHSPPMVQYIKMLSHQAGFYDPASALPLPSLKFMCGTFFSKNKNQIVDYSNIRSSLSPELNSYLNDLNKVDRKLFRSLSMKGLKIA